MVREIPLQNGMVALIDDEDYPRVAQHKWTAANVAKRDGRPPCWYVKRQITVDGKSFNIWLHRFILGVPDGVTVDHEDRDTLNNQKFNLRMASSRQQAHNRRKQRGSANAFKGVVKASDSNRWTAWISHEGKRRYLGIFRTPEEAARIFDAAASHLHGEFAWTNFPEIHPDAAAYVVAVFENGQPPARQRPRSLLTTAQVHEIRADYAAGRMNQKQLSEKYGCHYSTICRIIRKNRYSDDVLDEVIGRAA